MSSLQTLAFTTIGFGSNLLNTTYLSFLQATYTDINISSDTEVSDYKMASGVNYTNYYYNRPLSISLDGVKLGKPIFSNGSNYNEVGITVVLEALKLQQVFAPLTLITPDYTGFVELLSYSFSRNANGYNLSLELRQKSLYKPFEELKFEGVASNAISIESGFILNALG